MTTATTGRIDISFLGGRAEFSLLSEGTLSYCVTSDIPVYVYVTSADTQCTIGNPCVYNSNLSCRGANQQCILASTNYTTNTTGFLRLKLLILNVDFLTAIVNYTYENSLSLGDRSEEQHNLFWWFFDSDHFLFLGPIVLVVILIGVLGLIAYGLFVVSHKVYESYRKTPPVFEEQTTLLE